VVSETQFQLHPPLFLTYTLRDSTISSTNSCRWS